MRTSDLLYDLLAKVSEVGRSLSSLSERAAGASPEALAGLCQDLLTGRGEATGLALARQILERVKVLSTAERAAFFEALRTRFGVNPERLRRAVERWQAEPSDEAARALHAAAEPRAQELIRQLNRVPGATATLVAMRRDLIRAMAENPGLRGLDEDFRHLFGSWFNRGFLELRTIDWSTPAAILEKIIRYEAVHAIADWDDLRRRVAAPDRRLYAFFHPALTQEPLIFVEVALTEAIPSAIGPILTEERPELAPKRATTAVFYSISNCQEGLRGVSFGNFLIKQVVEDLQAEFPGLRTFVTLSPVPGLRAWALEHAVGEEQAMVEALESDKAVAAEALAPLAARYLVEARHPRGGALDPVARFHLGNGARLEQINTGADTSERGRRNAWGVMVNYLYDLDHIEKNHEAYAEEGAIATASQVRRLLKSRRTAASA
ncbi:MAG: malonyl-CoA decarboxylase [Pseudomonadota bacterium]